MIIPLPTYTEPEPEPTVQVGQQDYSWISDYWKCEDWICEKCQARMFGRMTYCVYCKYRGEKT